MSHANQKDTVRIDLTPKQREQVKNATGRDSVAIELTIEELEERVSPSSFGGGADPGRLAANHNESLLADR